MPSEAAYAPAEHAVHTPGVVAASKVLYVPAAHGAQAEAPVTALYPPGAHGAQVASPGLAVPTGQGMPHTAKTTKALTTPAQGSARKTVSLTDKLHVVWPRHWACTTGMESAAEQLPTAVLEPLHACSGGSRIFP